MAKWQSLPYALFANKPYALFNETDNSYDSGVWDRDRGLFRLASGGHAAPEAFTHALQLDGAKPAAKPLRDPDARAPRMSVVRVAAREQAADREFLAYDFGQDPKGSYGWQFQAQHNTWVRSVFFTDPDNPDGAGLEGRFVVVFSRADDAITDAYAVLNGHIIGRRAPAAAMDGAAPVPAPAPR